MGITTTTMCTDAYSTLKATPPTSTRSAKASSRPATAKTQTCVSKLRDDVARSRPRRQSLPEARRPAVTTGNRPRRHSMPAIMAPSSASHTVPAPAWLRAATPPAKAGALPPVKPLSAKVQIPKKQFMMLKAVFDEHDADRDGYLTLEDFIGAVTRMDARKSQSEGERRGALCFDETTRQIVGRTAEKAYLEGKHAQRQHHAAGMFKAIVSKKSHSCEHISLLDFLSLSLPHLPKSAVKRAHDKYNKKPEPKRKTLDDVDGAKEEVAHMFRCLGPDHQGLVSISSLEPRLEKLGFSSKDVNDMLAELPPPLFRAQGDINAPEQAQLCRQKSKLSLQDVEKLFEPVFVLQDSPKAA